MFTIAWKREGRSENVFFIKSLYVGMNGNNMAKKEFTKKSPNDTKNTLGLAANIEMVSQFIFA